MGVVMKFSAAAAAVCDDNLKKLSNLQNSLLQRSISEGEQKREQPELVEVKFS